MNESQTKVCQNCKNQFTIEPDDFQFYQKINVPPPTFCFYCRVQRRMSFRNERVLHKRKCDFPGHTEELISIFSPDNPQRVYDHATWWGDGWDALSYGRDIDWSKPFLSQIKDLWREVPDMALLNINPVNSEYCSITEGNKNCYLVFGGDFNEDTLYSTYIFRSKFSVDTYWVQKGEFNYETVDCTSCSRLLYSRYCEGCYDSAFLLNCRNSHDCIGCVNVVNGAYQIFNVQYTKEEYFQQFKELNLSSRKGVQEVKEKFLKHALGYPKRFAKLIHSVNSSGDNLENCKNCFHCFDAFEGAEDCRRMFLSYSKASDSVDVDRVGLSAQTCYEGSGIYPGNKVFFSRFIFSGQDVQYSYNSHNVAYLFGCVGVRNKKYCILNKQYTQEEYEALIPKIIQHMKDTPYVDKKDRVYQYGEFFPAEFSPFAYNETLAGEMMPLSKEEAEQQGYAWYKLQDKNYTPTKREADIPDLSKDIPDSIINEVIECSHWAATEGSCNEQCTKAFRIVPAELQFYRKMNIPLPSLCPSCRHFSRVKQRNPIRLWKRNCHCHGKQSEHGTYNNTSSHFHGEGVCTNEFETSYAPERSEIVYCESCYQQEVA